MFAIRTTKPEAGNLFYIRKASGGFSSCIQGNPKDSACDTIANCVGYAIGRFNEIIGRMLYPGLNGDAENFITKAKNLGLEVTIEPTPGGIMVWSQGIAGNSSDGAGHVAICEKVIDTNTVYTSESNYGGTIFFNATRTNTNGRWGLNNTFTYLGCIKNPSVTYPEPEPVPTPDEPKGLTDEQLLDLTRRTIRGDFGNGEKRKNALGTNYTAVQTQVNANLRAGITQWDKIRLF